MRGISAIAIALAAATAAAGFEDRGTKGSTPTLDREASPKVKAEVASARQRKRQAKAARRAKQAGHA